MTKIIAFVTKTINILSLQLFSVLSAELRIHRLHILQNGKTLSQKGGSQEWHLICT